MARRAARADRIPSNQHVARPRRQSSVQSFAGHRRQRRTSPGPKGPSVLWRVRWVSRPRRLLPYGRKPRCPRALTALPSGCVPVPAEAGGRRPTVVHAPQVRIVRPKPAERQRRDCWLEPLRHRRTAGAAGERRPCFCIRAISEPRATLPVGFDAHSRPFGGQPTMPTGIIRSGQGSSGK